jgi:hypothetical protein
VFPFYAAREGKRKTEQMSSRLCTFAREIHPHAKAQRREDKTAGFKSLPDADRIVMRGGLEYMARFVILVKLNGHSFLS